MGIKSMIETRGKERNSSLIQGIPIARPSPSSFTMSWFWFLWAANYKGSLLLQDKYSCCSFTGNTLEVYLRHTFATSSLHQECTKQQGQENEQMHHAKSQELERRREDGRNSLSHLLAEGKERGNKSAITNDLFLKFQFIPYLLS